MPLLASHARTSLVEITPLARHEELLCYADFSLFARCDSLSPAFYCQCYLGRRISAISYRGAVLARMLPPSLDSSPSAADISISPPARQVHRHGARPRLPTISFIQARRRNSLLTPGRAMPPAQASRPSPSRRAAPRLTYEAPAERAARAQRGRFHHVSANGADSHLTDTRQRCR